MKPKPEFRDLIKSVGIRLPPGVHPIIAIKDCGCENDHYVLTVKAKRIICKYSYCPHNGVCIEVS